MTGEEWRDRLAGVGLECVQAELALQEVRARRSAWVREAVREAGYTVRSVSEAVGLSRVAVDNILGKGGARRPGGGGVCLWCDEAHGFNPCRAKETYVAASQPPTNQASDGEVTENAE